MGKNASPVPVTERLAIRNALAVGAVFAGLRGLRSLRRKKSKSRSAAADDGWTEALQTASAAGLTAEVFSRVQTLTGSSTLGGILSILPLKYLSDNPKFHFNYRFVVAYLAAQVLVGALPRTKLRNVLVMMFTASQLLGWWVLSDERLPQDYIRFLDKEGKVDRNGRDETGRLVRGSLYEVRRVFRNECGTRTWDEFLSLVFPRPGDGSLAAKYDSKNSVLGFQKAALHYFALHFREAVPFYLKVYSLRLFAAALRKGPKAVGGGVSIREGIALLLAGDPVVAQASGTLLSFATDIARSAGFLSLYCTLPWWMCGMVAYAKPGLASGASRPHMWLALSVPGLAILVESKAQQTTIANYCATFGLYPALTATAGGFDFAAALTAALCSSGMAKRPMLLNLLWPADPAGAKARKIVLASRAAGTPPKPQA